MLNSLSENFCKSVSTEALKFRWFTCNCYQFELPSGKRILFDPFLPNEDSDGYKFAEHYCGYLPKDLEKVDYVIINHTHGDHIGSLKETYNLYKPRVLCHASVAFEIARDEDVPQRMIFPFENEKEYIFDDFTLATITGRHGGPADPKPMKDENYPENARSFLNSAGWLFNTNFFLTTNNNFKIYFCAGTFDENERHVVQSYRPDIFIRQAPYCMYNNDIKTLADEFMLTGARILLPLHHEQPYENVDCNDYALRMNQYLEGIGYCGRMINPKSGKWYSISTVVETVEEY